VGPQLHDIPTKETHTTSYNTNINDHKCVFLFPAFFFFASKNDTGLLPEELEIFTDLFEKLRRWGGWEVKQSSEIFDGRGRQ